MKASGPLPVAISITKRLRGWPSVSGGGQTSVSNTAALFIHKLCKRECGYAGCLSGRRVMMPAPERKPREEFMQFKWTAGVTNTDRSDKVVSGSSHLIADSKLAPLSPSSRRCCWCCHCSPESLAKGSLAIRRAFANYTFLDDCLHIISLSIHCAFNLL